MTGSCTETDTTYAAAGNITKKNGLTYTYPTGAGVARAHAVSSLKNSQGKITASYTYDANGNMTSDDGREFTYIVFDQMTKMTRGTRNTLEFTYGIDRQRNFRRETVSGSITKT